MEEAQRSYILTQVTGCLNYFSFHLKNLESAIVFTSDKIIMFIRISGFSSTKKKKNIKKESILPQTQCGYSTVKWHTEKPVTFDGQEKTLNHVTMETWTSALSASDSD